jgi:hypothetical protein
MDIADQLQKLHQLHVSGALSAEEFTKAKQAILNGSPDRRTQEGDKQPSTLRGHLMRPAAHQPQEPQGESKATPVPVVPAAAEVPALAYGPVAPKVAELEADERHLYTFTINPATYRQFNWFPPQLPGWFVDGTRFIWHLTDKRILVEPYEVGKTEGLLSKGLLAVGKMNRAGKAFGEMSGVPELEAGRQEMAKMKGQWFAISHTEIARVERQELEHTQKIACAITRMSLAKVVFKNPAVEPLVIFAQAARAGLFSLVSYSKEFIEAMGQILQAGGKGDLVDVRAEQGAPADRPRDDGPQGNAPPPA